MKIEFFLENTLMDLLKDKSIDSIHVKDIIAELGICKGTFLSIIKINTTLSSTSLTINSFISSTMSRLGRNLFLEV